MDNLTHSLAGAVLGQMGLKKKTGLGMATLIIAANIPDIDALAVLMGGQQHLAIRRGLTHGPIAMLVLPLILTGLMICFDRWQAKRGKRPEGRLPVHKGWLLALAFIGTLSHPAMDWLNSYGVRVLEPFSSTWIAGDSIFIIDIWIWIALIAGVWISRRREKSNMGNWQRPAWISFAAICAYIFANGAITGVAEARTTHWLKYSAHVEPELVVANPLPVTFWKRAMLWRSEDRYGQKDFDIFSPDVERYQKEAGEPGTQNDFDHPAVARAGYIDPEARAYLFWTRMPVATVEDRGENFLVTLRDQRFMISGIGDRFVVRTAVPKDRLEPGGE
ncbi:metal-dependent hydrolase [Parasphingorhabdus halotolerans]|uniref:Metal-dependent hydrolase n=1 Tax=Parasphingorhabdus halotolerans TaxID=2725558 RepID=A0A6H2DGZ2_9SPHN|nr:metal-dependent hydrolase [Parasphingorhabdus halotolerans]QJB67939.1 metal-dependent hydrolase [Parasphingorhabdus halotolerans]